MGSELTLSTLMLVGGFILGWVLRPLWRFEDLWDEAYRLGRRHEAEWFEMRLLHADIREDLNIRRYTEARDAD